VAQKWQSIGSRTCKPNSVRRIAPAGRSFLWATHRCEALATYPKVGRAEPARARSRSRELPSYLVLLRVWFALPAALLPRRCALTAPFHPYPHPERCGRYVFCGTFRRTGLNPASRTLSGTLLCGVRTFLSPRPKTRKATVRSSCQQNHYMRNSCRRTSDLGPFAVSANSLID
jgi:hypothetical protein